MGHSFPALCNRAANVYFLNRLASLELMHNISLSEIRIKGSWEERGVNGGEGAVRIA